MSSPHDSDLGPVQRNVLDQTEQKQIKEVQDFAQRLSNSQNFDQASESTQESDSVSFLLQDLDPLHTDFIIIFLYSNTMICSLLFL